MLESLNVENINILSLGCGFYPDYYALSQYITDKNLAIFLDYNGIDNSSAWETTQITQPNIHIIQADVLQLYSFKNAHVIMVNKLFSTILRHKKGKLFLSNLTNTINNTMDKNSVLIFNDVNHIDFGRDKFDNNISPLFLPENITRYYTSTSTYKESSWKKINQNHIVCPITSFSSVEPFTNIRQNVFFEYRK